MVSLCNNSVHTPPIPDREALTGLAFRLNVRTIDHHRAVAHNHSGLNLGGRLRDMDSSAVASASGTGESTQEMGAHLWIPEPDTKDPSSDQTVSSPRLPQLLRGRLYVGNLSPTVDE
jgi:hypothetical protein